jgi:beta-aspartyl-peptidase (threonine type)
MTRLSSLCIAAVLVMANAAHAADIVLAVHGGAGAIAKENMTADKERAVRADLTRALRAGSAVLQEGGSSLEAVTRAVVILEDSPHFNAGKGAVFNHDGVNELDASIMEGHTRRAGAVASVHRIKNPILLARAVMEKSPHVMMVGQGAEQFAQRQGFELIDPAYFRTDERWKELQDKLKQEREAASTSAKPGRGQGKDYTGTVGAVARDRAGHLAAATSTGGMTNKRYGRVGDSPVIGAGTYATDVCAVSATGWGEYYIRAAAAHEICARVAYKGESIEQAAHAVVMEQIPALGGDGGVIALDAQGHVAMPYNTAGMYRGSIDAEGKIDIAFYRE